MNDKEIAELLGMRIYEFIILQASADEIVNADYKLNVVNHILDVLEEYQEKLSKHENLTDVKEKIEGLDPIYKKVSSLQKHKEPEEIAIQEQLRIFKDVGENLIGTKSRCTARIEEMIYEKFFKQDYETALRKKEVSKEEIIKFLQLSNYMSNGNPNDIDKSSIRFLKSLYKELLPKWIEQSIDEIFNKDEVNMAEVARILKIIKTLKDSQEELIENDIRSINSDFIDKSVQIIKQKLGYDRPTGTKNEFAGR